MSGQNTESTDLKRWKDKCFAQADELEAQEKSFDEYVSLMQRLLVRVSLAAEGLNEGLDVQLESLRDQFRKEKEAVSRSDLAKRLEKIEASVLELDEQKSYRTDQVLDALERLVDQLLELELQGNQKKQLRQLSKQVKSRKSGLKEFPTLLSQYAKLQNDALKLQLTSADAGEKQGFLQRLLGASKTNSSNGAQSEPEIPSEVERQSTDLDMGAKGENKDEHKVVPGYSAISDHVSVALSNLIEQLSIPPNVESTAEKIQTTIRAGLNWYELGPTIDDVANLVISAVGKGQKDFEHFLQSLDSRLEKLQSYLTESQAQQLDWKGSSDELDRTVRDHVNSISQDVRDADDVEQLRTSVTGHLDRIILSMDEFVKEEDNRVEDMTRQMEVLQHRLVSMEAETTEIRDRLTVERAKALTDVLTGLANREAYEERISMEFDRWNRYRQPAVMVVADIDHFKRVNDHYGHLAGDKVIQIIAKEITERIRKTDFVARYGGEEFVIIMPETELPAALIVMEKTREMISRLPFHFRNERVQITMSFGVAAFQNANVHPEIFDQADKALYKAKDGGRNRVAVFQSDASD